MDQTDSNALPPRLKQIVEDFQICEGREKIDLLLEYAEKLPPLPRWLDGKQNKMDKVDECMTPVYVQAKADKGRMIFYFDVPRESPTVRGFAALMSEGLQDASPEEVLRIPSDFYFPMGLHQVLTRQRMNGIASILIHMKQLALTQISKA
jgi:cysteine desulfuration protein SufE